MDRSLKMLRMAKARVMKRNGKVPDNLLFLQADALYLPFKEQSFSTILCENLLHCLGDTRPLLQQTNAILSKNGRMYFTTLVKAGRLADNYLEALAGSFQVAGLHAQVLHIQALFIHHNADNFAAA